MQDSNLNPGRTRRRMIWLRPVLSLPLLIAVVLGSSCFDSVAVADPKLDIKPEAADSKSESSADSSSDDVIPYEAKWPDGWEKSELPGPRPNSGRDLHGKRTRLIKKDAAGKPSVVIEVTYFSRPASSSDMDLDYEFSTSLKTIKQEYEAKNFVVTFSPTRSSKIGGLKDFEADVISKIQGRELHQFDAMALSGSNLYNITYSGLEANYAKELPVFEEFRKSLSLK